MTSESGMLRKSSSVEFLGMQTPCDRGRQKGSKLVEMLKTMICFAVIVGTGNSSHWVEVTGETWNMRDEVEKHQMLRSNWHMCFYNV